MEYAIVIEKSPRNYSAYVPDLPGCVATGATNEHVVQMIRQAIEFHVEGLRVAAARRCCLQVRLRQRLQRAGSKVRPRYKHQLFEAVRANGITPRLGGIELAEEIVQQMDIESAARADSSLRRFVEELRRVFRQWGDRVP